MRHAHPAPADHQGHGGFAEGRGPVEQHWSRASPRLRVASTAIRPSLSPRWPSNHQPRAQTVLSRLGQRRLGFPSWSGMGQRGSEQTRPGWAPGAAGRWLNSRRPLPEETSANGPDSRQDRRRLGSQRACLVIGRMAKEEQEKRQGARDAAHRLLADNRFAARYNPRNHRNRPGAVGTEVKSIRAARPTCAMLLR